jgi:hypothetical protein
MSGNESAENQGQEPEKAKRSYEGSKWGEGRLNAPKLPDRRCSPPVPADQAEIVPPPKRKPLRGKAGVKSVEDKGGAEIKADGPDVPATLAIDLRRHSLWVYDNLDNRRMSKAKSPSSGAWSLLQWARTYRTRFFEHYLPKTAKDLQDEDEREVVKWERKSVAEIKAVLKQFQEAGKQ